MTTGTIPMVSLRSELAGLSGADRFDCYRRLWNAAGRYELITDFPMHLDIELSSRCNLLCPNCFQNGLISEETGLMSYEFFQRIIDEGAEYGLCAAKLQVRGESMLHPRLFDAISFAKAAGIIDLQLTTNATILGEAERAGLLDSGLDGIIFSYDRHHRDGFAGDYDTVVGGNITEFLRQRAGRGKARPWVRIQASVEDDELHHWSEREQELRARFPEADVVVLNRMQNYRYDQDSYSDLSQNYDLLPCPYLNQRLLVYWDGSVTVCCMDYARRFALGNLAELSLHEIWRSDRLEKIRKLHCSGKRTKIEVCAHCQVAVRRKNGNK